MVCEFMIVIVFDNKAFVCFLIFSRHWSVEFAFSFDPSELPCELPFVMLSRGFAKLTPLFLILDSQFINSSGFFESSTDALGCCGFVGTINVEVVVGKWFHVFEVFD